MTEQANQTEEVVDSIELFTSGKAPKIEAQGMIPWVFANDKDNPTVFGLLDMFYDGAFTNTLGIMIAKNITTNEEEAVLVGLVKQDGEIAAYPIAKVLNKEASTEYLPPDGEGGWIDHRNAE